VQPAPILKVFFFQIRSTFKMLFINLLLKK